MFELLKNKLQQPHPAKITLSSILLPGIIVAALLFFMAPYGLYTKSLSERMLIALIFGAITSITSLLTVGALKICFPKIMDESSWTLGKEFVLLFIILTAIALSNAFCIWVFAFSNDPLPKTIANSFFIVYSMGVFPAYISALYEQNTLRVKQLELAAQQNIELQKYLELEKEKNQAQNRSTEPIAFTAENDKVELQLHWEQLLFLKSDGNYVEIYFENEHQKLQTALIRNRLKVLAEALPENYFFQCHRSYLVNLQKIVQIKGNARSLGLKIQLFEDLIPVSRSKTTALTQILKNS